MVRNPAGFGNRFIALLIDGFILFSLNSFVGLLVYKTLIIEGFSFMNIIQVLYTILLPVLWHGYTIGKRAVGVRIVRTNGEDVGIGSMLLRSIVAGLFYGLTCGIGVIVSAFMVLFRDDHRAIHDLIADTFVTHDKPEENEE